MPVCAVCSSLASSQCSRCKAVHYCSPAHQKADWKAHKVDCSRLAQEALSAVFHPCDEELLLRITTCLAQNGYHKEVGTMVQLNKAFWNDEQIWDAYKDVPGPRGRTRLMYASAYGSLSRVKRLLARGARVNTASFIHGYTALTGAIENGRLEVVRELCNVGTDVHATLKSDGSTALMKASQAGHEHIVRELCARGANVNAARKDNGATVLLIASAYGHLEVARLLLQKGANKFATTANGCTAFSEAKGPHKAALQALLKP